MDTQVERVNEWRAQKRAQGYQPLTVWLKADIKHKLEDLAAQRRQDLGQVLTEAILMVAGPPRRPADIDMDTVRRMIDDRLAQLAPPPPPLPVETPVVETAAEETPPQLQRGDYGAIRQAARDGARELRRFTCLRLATYINYDGKKVHSALAGLVKRGELRKVGLLYHWIDKKALAP